MSNPAPAPSFGLQIGDTKDSLVEDDGRPRKPIVKDWTPAAGVLGYFAKDRYDFLPRISQATETDIADENQDIKISLILRGSTNGQVQQTIDRLNALESAMDLVNNPISGTAAIATERETVSYWKLKYATINSLGNGRVLFDPVVTPASRILSMIAPIAYHYDKEENSWSMLKNLFNPPRLESIRDNCLDTTLAWKGFMYDGIGQGAQYFAFPTSVFYPRDAPTSKPTSREPIQKSPSLSIAKESHAFRRVAAPATTASSESGHTSHLPEPSNPFSVPTGRSDQTVQTRALAPTKTSAGVLQAFQAKSKNPSSGKIHTSPKSKLPLHNPRETSSSRLSVQPWGAVAKVYSNFQMNASDFPELPSVSSGSQIVESCETLINLLDDSEVQSSQGSRNPLPGQAILEDLIDLDWESEKEELPPVISEQELQPESLLNANLVTDTESVALVKASFETKASATTLTKSSVSSSPSSEYMSLPSPSPESPKPPLNDLIDFDEPEIMSFPSLTSGELTTNLPTLQPHDLLPQLSSSFQFDDQSIDQNQTDNRNQAENFVDSVNVQLQERVGYLQSCTPMSPPALPVPPGILPLGGIYAPPGLPIPPGLSISPGFSVSYGNYPSLRQSISPWSSSRPQPSLRLPVYPVQTVEVKREEPKSKLANPEVRELHSVMKQQAPKGQVKKKGFTESKAVIEAKRKAAVSDAWGQKSQALKLKPPTEEAVRTSSSIPIKKEVSKTALKKERVATLQMDILKSLFRILRRCLDPATCFPGPLTLELQFGLLLFSSAIDSSKMQHLSLQELRNFYDPRDGLDSTKSSFFNRLTSSPADVDFIIDTPAGSSSMFEKEPSSFKLEYEFHCQSAGSEFIIYVDEHGEHNVKTAENLLGTVNLNFPNNIWDAAILVKGNLDRFKDPRQGFKGAIQKIVDNLWVEGKRLHVRLLTRTSKEVKIAKVLVKRITEHRRLHSEGKNSQSQDIILRIVETQDLIISMTEEDEEVIQAHCGPLAEMTKESRQWWTASLISPLINTVLKSNENLEPGQRTNDWVPADLFGDDAQHLLPAPIKPSTSSMLSSDLTTALPSQISSAIGFNGIGHLVRLAETIVRNIDAVGGHNIGLEKDSVLSYAAISASHVPCEESAVPESQRSVVSVKKKAPTPSGRKREIW
ncbi:hypothetical protein N7456_008448 [Penicillium angulare]|uniref:Uncharacterized protein n=1 Tax=Penicillium angulare TaxID=116970 RepID=A0A9W9KA93_9EURO|nr:hypothetical protein N7456_008448 [Penicillium angulare]